MSTEEAGAQLTSDQIELKQLREFYAAIYPKLARINNLIEAGWVQAKAGDDLIDVMIREITLSRAERISPGMEPHLPSICMSAFATMCDVLEKSIPNNPMPIHQQRYNAFCVGVNQIVPVIKNDTVLQNYRETSALIQFHMKNYQNMLDTMMGPGGIDTEDRVAKIQNLQCQIEALTFLNEEVVAIAGGGLTAPQALQRHINGQRIPDSASVN